jgi:hypothetical protein
MAVTVVNSGVSYSNPVTFVGSIPGDFLVLYAYHWWAGSAILSNDFNVIYKDNGGGVGTNVGWKDATAENQQETISSGGLAFLWVVLRSDIANTNLVPVGSNVVRTLNATRVEWPIFNTITKPSYILGFGVRAEATSPVSIDRTTATGLAYTHLPSSISNRTEIVSISGLATSFPIGTENIYPDGVQRYSRTLQVAIVERTLDSTNAVVHPLYATGRK